MISYQEVGPSLSERNSRKNNFSASTLSNLEKLEGLQGRSAHPTTLIPAPASCRGALFLGHLGPSVLICGAWPGETRPTLHPWDTSADTLLWGCYIPVSQPPRPPTARPTPASSAPSGCNYINESMCAQPSPRYSPTLPHISALACSVILTWGDYNDL